MSKDDLLSHKYRPLVLLILDGWGVAGAQEGNAIHLAKTPFFDELAVKYPALILNASGEAVGLGQKDPGNGQAGHLTLGAGRPVSTGLEQVNQAVKDKSFFKNTILNNTWRQLKKTQGTLHLIGTLSACQNEVAFGAMVELAGRKKIKPFLHLIIDEAIDDKLAAKLTVVEAALTKAGGAMATLMNVTVGLNLKNDLAATALAYHLITAGVGRRVGSLQKLAEKNNADGAWLDKPIVLVGSDNKPRAVVQAGDAVIFFDYEPRARHLLKAVVVGDSDNKIQKISDLQTVTLNNYENDLPAAIIFPPLAVKETLSEVLARADLKQLKISETGKSVEVNYFFNGGRMAAWPNEERVIVASPAGNAADFTATEEVGQVAAAKIKSKIYDFIVINLAGADEAGHGGNLEAVKKAVEQTDQSLRQIIKAVLEVGGLALVTADHGQAEEMIDWQLDAPRPKHTDNPVPFLVVAKKWEGYNLGVSDAVAGDLSLLKPSGDLADVAPTILKLLQIEAPEQMTGHSLL